jgi:hypothetical protein
VTKAWIGGNSFNSYFSDFNLGKCFLPFNVVGLIVRRPYDIPFVIDAQADAPVSGRKADHDPETWILTACSLENFADKM